MKKYMHDCWRLQRAAVRDSAFEVLGTGGTVGVEKLVRLRTHSVDASTCTRLQESRKRLTKNIRDSFADADSSTYRNCRGRATSIEDIFAEHLALPGRHVASSSPAAPC